MLNPTPSIISLRSLERRIELFIVFLKVFELQMLKSSQSILYKILNDFREQCWFYSWGSAAVHKAFRQCSCSLWCQKCNPWSELYIFVFMPGHLITLRFIDSPAASTSWQVLQVWAALFFSSTQISGKSKVPGLKCDVTTVREEC